MKSHSETYPDNDRKAQALEYARQVVAKMRACREAEAAARVGATKPEPAPGGVDEISPELRACRARRRAEALARFGGGE